MTAEEYITHHWIPNKVWTHLAWPKHRARLKQCADMVVGERFADVGCACGHSTDIMAGFHPGKWTGIDFSATGITMADTLFPELDFLYIHDLPGGIPLEPYDSVVCSEVVEHVEDDGVLIRALMGITLKRLILTTPSKQVDDPGHLRVYDVWSLGELLKGYKYSILDRDNTFYVGVEK